MIDTKPIATETSGVIRAGIGGWTFAPWRNNFYPAKLPQKRELEFASRQLRAIEVNGTFYRAQQPSTYASWAAMVPDGFVFSLKAPRYVVENKLLAHASGGAKAFIDGGLAELGAHLGPLLWQFSPWRVFNADDLAAFLEHLPRTLNGTRLRHVLEVRHHSFADARYVELARAHDVATVFTDSDNYPSLADATGSFRYARLMRSEDGEPTGYPSAALDTWAQRAKTWAAGEQVAELPHVAALAPRAAPMDVFMFFISAAKHRNPAAAMALQQRVDA